MTCTVASTAEITTTFHIVFICRPSCWMSEYPRHFQYKLLNPTHSASRTPPDQPQLHPAVTKHRETNNAFQF
jgi:hypothetical protein